MKIALYLIFVLSISFNSFSQEKSVYLVEEKLKKRTILSVKNDTDQDKSVFLKVNPKGYRRSAQRPVIKNIPAKSKVEILILIPLKDTISSYTYNLVVNDALESIDVKRSKISKQRPAPEKDSLSNQIM